MQIEAPESFKRFIEDLKNYESVEDELLLKQTFNYGLDVLRKEYALKLFAESKLSIGEGAELANLSVREFLELLASRGVKSKITVEDYRQGLKHAEEMLRE
ncbi:MAG: UPF0175 family protein [Archaeoglobaceae archaeon]